MTRFHPTTQFQSLQPRNQLIINHIIHEYGLLLYLIKGGGFLMED